MVETTTQPVSVNRRVLDRLIRYSLKVYEIEKGFARYVEARMKESEASCIQALGQSAGDGAPNLFAVSETIRSQIQADLTVLGRSMLLASRELVHHASRAVTLHLDRAVPKAIRKAVATKRAVTPIVVSEKLTEDELFDDDPFDSPDPMEFEFFRRMRRRQVTAILDQLNSEGLGQDKWDEVSRVQSNRIRDIVATEMATGKSTSEIASILHTAMFGGKPKGLGFNTFAAVDGLTRTMVQSVNNRVLQETWNENRDVITTNDEGVVQVTWVATLDTRTCKRCGLIDGRVFSNDEVPGPPLHVRCRCVTTPVLKSWEELGIDGIGELSAVHRISMDGLVPAKTSYVDWFTSQSPERQRSILGPARFKMWQRGNLEFEDFVSFANKVPTKVRTLKSLRTRVKNAGGDE